MTLEVFKLGTAFAAYARSLALSRPSGTTGAITFVMGDLRVEKFPKKDFDEVAETARFWHPTDDDSERRGMGP